MALSDEERKARKRAQAKAYRLRNLEKERERCRRWAASNPEKKKAKDVRWYARNATKKLAWAKQWHEKNREKKSAAVKEWVAKNADRKRATLKAWREKNPEKVGAAEKRAQAKALSTPAGKLRNAIKAQLNYVLRGKASRTDTIKTFGYPVEHLVQHLEAQFRDGMTWESYGPRGWHIDHIRPVASFVFIRQDGTVDYDQIRACYALDNLRPLWAADNLRKGPRDESGRSLVIRKRVDRASPGMA